MVYKIGSKGSVVRQIQQKLNCQITGVYDTATKRAVLDFQKKNNLQQNGDTDEATMLTMFPPKVKKTIKPVKKVVKLEKKPYSQGITKETKNDTTKL